MDKKYGIFHHVTDVSLNSFAIFGDGMTSIQVVEREGSGFHGIRIVRDGEGEDAFNTRQPTEKEYLEDTPRLSVEVLFDNVRSVDAMLRALEMVKNEMISS